MLAPGLYIALTAGVLLFLLWPILRRRPPGDTDWSGRIPFGLLAIGGFTGLLCIPIALAITIATAGTPTVQSSYTLRALATGSETTGQFFLGSGYINDERVFSYLQEVGDYTTLETAKAARSRVYEDGADNPRVESVCPTLDAWWFAPEPMTSFMACRTDFHVPAGSVLESYEVTP